MNRPADPMLRRSSPPSRPRPAGSGLRPGLDSGCGPASDNQRRKGSQEQTHSTTRSARRENRVSTKPGAVHGADWTCSDTWKLTAHLMHSFGSTTDWANKPATNANDQPQTLQVKPGPNPNSSCVQQTIDFNVAYAMNLAKTNSWSKTSFGFYGDETLSSTNFGFMRLGNNPKITTVYDIVPPVPTSTTTSPTGHFYPGGPAVACATSSPYPWVGLTGKTGFTLKAHVAPALTDEDVRGVFWIHDPGGEIANYPENAAWVAGPHTASHAVGFTLADGDYYGWDAQANVNGNGLDVHAAGYTSAKTTGCHFYTDFTPPDPPAVTSSDFPPAGSVPGTTLRAGDSGSFTLTATDPDPASGCVTASPCGSGIYNFEYSFNAPIPASGSATTLTPSSVTGNTSSVTITIPVGDWGINILYVEATDMAGNQAQSTYTFYVPPNSSITSGNENPDLLATTTSGNLLSYPISSTSPAITSTADTAGTAATSPDGTSWNTYKITHRGSLSENNVDDIFAKKGANLYLYRNNPADLGVPPQFDNGAVTSLAKPACQPTTDNAGNCATYHTADWTTATQILAIGDAWDATATDTHLTSLVTIENDELWIYQAIASPDNGTLITGITLPASTYPNLASPGPLDNTAYPYPGLYAEDTTGTITYYPGQDTSTGAQPLNPTPQNAGTITPGSNLS